MVTIDSTVIANMAVTMALSLLIKDFPKDLHRELKIQAATLETSIKALVIRYCQEGLERDKKGKKKGG